MCVRTHKRTYTHTPLSLQIVVDCWKPHHAPLEDPKVRTPRIHICLCKLNIELHALPVDNVGAEIYPTHYSARYSVSNQRRLLFSNSCKDTKSPFGVVTCFGKHPSRQAVSTVYLLLTLLSAMLPTVAPNRSCGLRISQKFTEGLPHPESQQLKICHAPLPLNRYRMLLDYK